MAATADDPKRTTTYRVLLAVVIILGILIVLAFGALIVGGAMQLKHRAAAGGCLGDCGQARLPPDAKIVSTQVTGNRLIIVFHDAQGDGVEVVDADTGKHIALITPAPHGLPK